MTEPSPITAAVTALEASRQQAYAELIVHLQDCDGCDQHPLCDDGRTLWDRWKGRAAPRERLNGR